MDNLNDLKAIWQSADINPLPDATAVKNTVQTFQKQHVRKKWLVITGAITLTLLMLCATLMTGSKQATTWLGSALVMSASLLLAWTNWRSLGRFNQLDNCSNREFLAFIEQTSENQRYYYQKTQSRIMLLCSIGLLLYLYEPAMRHPLYTVILYLFCAVYLLFIWFVRRPKTYKRRAEKLELLRQHFEKLTNQLNENEN